MRVFLSLVGLMVYLKTKTTYTSARKHPCHVLHKGHAVNSQTHWSWDEESDAEAGYDGYRWPIPNSCSSNERSYWRRLLASCDNSIETYGSVTASNRSLQWRDKCWALCSDLNLTMKSCTFFLRSGFSDQLFKNIPCWKQRAAYRRRTREFNKGMWTIGYLESKPWAFERTPTELAHVPPKQRLLQRERPSKWWEHGLHRGC